MRNIIFAHLCITSQLSVYLNENYMEQTERIHLCVMNDNHMYSFVIVLDGAQLEDNGILSFVASNELGTSKASMKLTVLGKSSFTPTMTFIILSASYGLYRIALIRAK